VFDVINFVARCPTCEEWSAEVVSGTELEMLDMEIEEQQQGDGKHRPYQPRGW
jgi:Zn finger protein HypA/HybF involved in hydrogenase expression